MGTQSGRYESSDLEKAHGSEKRGSKLVVIDPRRTTTAAAADLWIAPNHGTDSALILGCIRFLLENHSFDHKFLLN